VSSAADAMRAFIKHAGQRSTWRKLGAVGLQIERSRLVPSRYVWEQYPSVKDLAVPMGEVRFHEWNMDPYELYFLSALALIRRPRLIFELGTFDGATTLALARLLPEVRILTLDLPDELSGAAARAQEEGRESSRSGSRFHGTPEQTRITQLYGDSRTFDFAPWLGAVDMVVVDAGHDYDCVHADTQTALRLVSDSGAVIWDDYCPRWGDVVRAVDEVAAEGTAFPVQIRGTEMAVWDRAAPHAVRSAAVDTDS
jgi:Methyltransferase domain